MFVVIGTAILLMDRHFMFATKPAPTELYPQTGHGSIILLASRVDIARGKIHWYTSFSVSIVEHGENPPYSPKSSLLVQNVGQTQETSWQHVVLQPFRP